MMPASRPTPTADVPSVWLRRPGTRRLEDRVVDEKTVRRPQQGSVAVHRVCQRFSVLIAYRGFVQWTNVSSTWMPPRNKCTIRRIIGSTPARCGQLEWRKKEQRT